MGLAWWALATPGHAAVFPGPDEFGYKAIEIPARLRDVRNTGLFLVLGDDQVSDPLPIGFEFRFYGLVYTTFRISSNGFITLGSDSQPDGCCTGQPLPSVGGPNNLVAGWWEDLNPPPGRIGFQTLGQPGTRELVIGFYEVPHFIDGPRTTWEIVLREQDDAIEIQCWDCTSDGGTHSVGIENGDGTIGLEIARTSSALSRAAWLLFTNLSPDCSAAVASPNLLWPPNQKFTPVSIAGVVDIDRDAVRITIDAVTHDEPVSRQKGKTTADALGIGEATARLRAARNPHGNGRVYRVEFTADDGRGGTCTGTATVCVPHDRKPRHCVDDAPPAPPPQPSLLESSDPPSGSSAVPHSAWIRLAFREPLASPASIELLCDGSRVERTVTLLDARTVVLNPRGLLPAGATCVVRWVALQGTGQISFSTAPGGPAASVLYDRRNRNTPLPFPDDFFLVPDVSTRTGLRPEVVVPNRTVGAEAFLNNMARNVRSLDGFSPIGGLGIELSVEPERATLPLSPDASLDRLATVGLFDLTPGSATYGQRVPFKLTPRSDTIQGQPAAHTLVIFPSIPLTPRGRYGLVVTNRVLSGARQPFGPSPFFAEVLSDLPGADATVARTRALALEVVEALERVAPVPIPREDVALAVRITVRSDDDIPADILALREDVLAAPLSFRVEQVLDAATDPAQEVCPKAMGAAVVTGSFDVPDWRRGAFFERDALGRPVVVGTRTIPFLLVLPQAAEAGFAPVVMHQHGSPGTALEVCLASPELAPEGYAVAGFTDSPNREFPGQDPRDGVLAVVLLTGAVPDYYAETIAQQIAFLRVLRALGNLDVVPLAAPDGVPDLDPSRLIYQGISQGSVHGQALLAYAPELVAAALVVGAWRLAEALEHQDRTRPGPGGPPFLVGTLPTFVPGLTPPDIWMGLTLFQMIFDRQDAHNHAAFIYRKPFLLDGTTKRASIVVIEAIDDGNVSNNATRSLAWTLGRIPLLEPVLVPVSYLPAQAGPIRANVDSETTAAMVQFCQSSPFPHYCGQQESLDLQRRFFRSALEQPVPSIER